MIWLNGRLMAPETARIDTADRGFLLGDGLFETLAAPSGRPFRIAEHLARMRSGLAALGIALALEDSVLAGALLDTIRASGLQGKDAGLRLTVSRGVGPRGLEAPAVPSPTVLIVAFPIPPPSRGPSRATIAGSLRNERSILAQVKSLNCLENVLARREAVARGFDEAILLNTKGRIAEASAANVFLVDGANRLATPALSEGALPGITRAILLRLAGNLGLEVREGELTPDQLAGTREAFLTGSLAGVRALSAIDGWVFQANGPVTHRLGAAYGDLVRAETASAHAPG